MAWMSGGRLATRFVDQIVVLVLARLLVPADFGIIAMASVFTRLLSLLTSMGLTRAIVQRPEVDEEYLSSAFWGNLTIGLALGMGGLGISGGIAQLYRESLVGAVFAVLSLRFVLTGGSAVQSALLCRQMRFRALQVRDTLSSSGAGVVAILLALNGAGVWSLVAQTLVADGLGIILLWRASGWRPKRRFSSAKFRELWRFGSRVLGSQFFNYVVKYSDTLIVGLILGAVQLGYYAFAYALFFTPLIDVTGVVWHVSLSAFSRVQKDAQRLRRGFLLTSKYVALLICPALVGLFLVAEDLIMVLFGSKWLPAVPVLRILLIAGVLRSQISIWNSILTALGRVGSYFRWSLLSAVVCVAAFLIGVRWGIVGVATGYTIATLMTAPFQLAHIQRLIGFRMREYFDLLAPILVATAVMTVGVIIMQRWLTSYEASGAIRLAGSISVGVLVYAASLVRAEPGLVAEFRRTIGSLRKPLRTDFAGERV